MHQILFQFQFFSGVTPRTPATAAAPKPPGRGGKGGKRKGRGREGGSLRHCRWGDRRLWKCANFASFQYAK